MFLQIILIFLQLSTLLHRQVQLNNYEYTVCQTQRVDTLLTLPIINKANPSWRITNPVKQGDLQNHLGKAVRFAILSKFSALALRLNAEEVFILYNSQVLILQHYYSGICRWQVLTVLKMSLCYTKLVKVTLVVYKFK